MTDSSARSFSGHCRQVIGAGFLSSLALGLVLAVLLLFVDNIEGSITIDIGLGRADSPWFLLGTPLLLTGLFILVSPVSWLLRRGLDRLTQGKGDAAAE